MSESVDDSRSGTRAPETAVVCDGNPMNLRFLRAAMQKLGFGQVIDTKNVTELVAQAAAHQPRVVVFDPAIHGGAGVDAIEPLQQRVPGALLVALCSDLELLPVLRNQGILTVEKVGIMRLDGLVAAVEQRLGRSAAPDGEEIPVADMDTPVWDLVPSLVDPDEP
jgi:CheY-like chemotaxis protein